MLHISKFAIQGADWFVAPYIGNFQGGVYQEQNYLSRPTNINVIALVLHVNGYLGCK